mgnify:CR=1 FL=1
MRNEEVVMTKAEKKRASNIRYRERYPEKVLESAKKWRENNKEKVLAAAKKYRENNKEKLREYSRNRNEKLSFMRKEEEWNNTLRELGYHDLCTL